VQRGSALDEPSAGVLVTLVGADGSALLHRVAPLTDAATAQADVRRICGDGGGAAPPGADCEVALRGGASSGEGSGGGGLVRRFQQGSVDEVSFKGPDLGPLAALVVGPEAGSWRCDEVDVASSRTGAAERFVCRELLGGGGAPAAHLRPVPPGAVVYGSGDSAVVLSKAEASQLHAWNMQQYSDLKAQLMAATTTLVALGTGVTWAAAGAELALPFALGGGSSLAYQFLLQRRVDGMGGGAAAGRPPVGAKPAQVRPGPALAAAVALSRPAVRAALMGAGLLGSLALLHYAAGEQAGGGGAAAPLGTEPVAAAGEVRRLVAGLAGFLMHKAALVGVAALPALSEAGPPGTGAAGEPRRGADRME
jgi:hypothetical protein